MKTCSKCRQEKPLSEFYPKDSKDPEGGRRARCKACLSQKGRAYTPEEKDQRAARARKRRAENPGAAWRSYLKAYGVTPEWYEEKIAEQGGGCAICGSEGCSTGVRFSVDHDHSCCETLPLCGKCARGLLCRSCNVGIGNLGDSPDRLRSAATYLEEYIS